MSTRLAAVPRYSVKYYVFLKGYLVNAIKVHNQLSLGKGDQGDSQALVVKNPPGNAGDIRDVGLIPGSERSPGGEHGNPLQDFAWRIPWTEHPSGLQSHTQSDTTEAT